MNDSTVYQSIPVASIREPSHQLRATIDPGALGELADSMATEGLHQPIGLRGPLDEDTYEIVWGHRRLLAARLLLWPTIDARVFPPHFDPLLASISENLHRTDLNPLEEARAVQRVQERGHPIAAIARLFRRSDSWVRERLLLLDLPDDLQGHVAERTLPLAVIRVLSEVDYVPYRGELIREAIRVGASTTTAEVWRAHYLADRDRIIHNQHTVEEIASRREAWRITIPCDLCHDHFEYPDTRTLRVCEPCLNELLRLVAFAASQTTAPAP